MPSPTSLLLFAALTFTAPGVLILKSGQRLEIGSTPKIEGERLLFRDASGTLYALPLTEIDEEATRTAAAPSSPPPAPPPRRSRLPVSDEEKRRLLEQLSQNRSGRPAPPQRILDSPPPPPTEEEVSEQERQEWSWRREAQAHEERIRQAREDHALLIEKAERLRAHIASLVAQGYKPRQFTYDSTQLQSTLEQIPYAELAIQRAERAYQQFREEARRRDILPGWLR